MCLNPILLKIRDGACLWLHICLPVLTVFVKAWRAVCYRKVISDCVCVCMHLLCVCIVQRWNVKTKDTMHFSLCIQECLGIILVQIFLTFTHFPLEELDRWPHHWAGEYAHTNAQSSSGSLNQQMASIWCMCVCLLLFPSWAFSWLNPGRAPPWLDPSRMQLLLSSPWLPWAERENHTRRQEKKNSPERGWGLCVQTHWNWIRPQAGTEVNRPHCRSNGKVTRDDMED